MALTGVHLSVALIACLMVVQVTAASASDPCHLPATKESVWFGLPSQVKSCFDAIPFSESTRKSTMKIMERVMSLYSFSDIVQAGLSPYLLNVDWPGMLNHVNTTTYNSDYDFHSALAAGMSTLLDAHTVYYIPMGYRSFSTTRAFSLTSSLVNGTQEFYAAPSRISADTYMKLCDCDTDLNEFYGRKILYINTIPVADFLVDMAAHSGLYLDPAAQLNNLLSASSPFTFQSTAFIPLPSDTLSIVFEGDLVGYSFNNFMTTSRPINSTQDIIALNTPKPKRDGFAEDPFLEEEAAVLRLLNDQRQRKSVSRVHKAKLDHHRNVLETTMRAFSENEKLRRRQAYAPAIRFQQIVDAWGAFLEAETNVPEWTPKQVEPRNMGAASTASTASTKSATAEIVIGLPKSLYSYEETPTLSYWSYDDKTVLRMKSFSPDEDKIQDFKELFAKAARSRNSNGLSGNLILDVSSNGGGYVCLSYAILSYLARPWNDHSLVGNDILFSPYDIRQSKYTDDVFERGYFGTGEEEINQANREPWGTSFYTSRVQRQYGLHTSNYTQEYLWNLCGNDNYEFAKNSVVFDKIIVITDGKCGSACSYFLTKLQLSGKVRVVSYGGHWGKPMDTSAFSGGNVHRWNDWMDELRDMSRMRDLEWIEYLPTTAAASYNFREMYNPGDSVPRQFIRMEADWHLPFWDPLHGSTDLKSASQKQALATLYASVTPLFEKMPSGLLGKNKSVSLIIALAVICVIITLTIIVVITAAIITSRRHSITADYGEISSLEP